MSFRGGVVPGRPAMMPTQARKVASAPVKCSSRSTSPPNVAPPTVVAAANTDVSPPLPPSDLSGLGVEALLSLLCVAMDAAGQSPSVRASPAWATVACWGPVARAALSRVGELVRDRDGALRAIEEFHRENGEARKVLAALAAAASDTRETLEAARAGADAAARVHATELASLRTRVNELQIALDAANAVVAKRADNSGSPPATSSGDFSKATRVLSEDRAAAADARSYDFERAVAAARSESSYWAKRAERAEALAEQLSGVISVQNDALAEAAFAGDDRMRVSDADWQRTREACGMQTDHSDCNNFDEDEGFESMKPRAGDDVEEDDHNNADEEGDETSDENETAYSRRDELRGELLLHAFGSRRSSSSSNSKGDFARRGAPPPRRMRLLSSRQQTEAAAASES
jgi:hypothetical protein